MESRDRIRLPPFDKGSGALNIIVETPKNGRIKYKYNESIFQFDKNWPYGFSFSFEFGFVASTIGGDGDPLDVLVLFHFLQRSARQIHILGFWQPSACFWS